MDSNKNQVQEDKKIDEDEIDDVLEKALEGDMDKLNLTADESVDEGNTLFSLRCIRLS